jgi:hypothetical protein
MIARIASGLGLVLAVLAFLAAGSYSRDACVTADHHATHGLWGFHALAIFGVVTATPSKTCESETMVAYGLGLVPGVGDWLERQVDGPANPDYYKYR